MRTEVQQIVEALLVKESSKEGHDLCLIGPHVIEDFSHEISLQVGIDVYGDGAPGPHQPVREGDNRCPSRPDFEEHLGCRIDALFFNACPCVDPGDQAFNRTQAS